MRFLVISLLTFLSMSTFATNKYAADVDSVFCGEMDPFAIGDICVVFTTSQKGKKKIAILVDMYEYLSTYQEGELDGQSVIVDLSSTDKIYGSKKLYSLNRYDNNYHYLDGIVDSLKVTSFSSKVKMNTFIKKISGQFYIGNIPEGYSAEKISFFELNGNFKKYLNKKTMNKVGQWKHFVFRSGEYSDLSLDEKKSIAKNPWKNLEVKYLLEIDDVYKIFQGKRLIGFYIEVNDHVQAAIYQDGAWIETFLDVNQKVIKATDESA
jgi:hypothetical protein